MHPRIRSMVLLSVIILLLVAFTLSGPVFPLRDILEGEHLLHPDRPDNATTPFYITVIPSQAHAHPGDPVDCEVIITPIDGFNEPVNLELEVDAGLVFRGAYNAGVMTPPYPRTYEYRVVVPPQSPAPLVVNGTLRARSGDYVDEVSLSLFIEP